MGMPRSWSRIGLIAHLGCEIAATSTSIAGGFGSYRTWLGQVQIASQIILAWLVPDEKAARRSLLKCSVPSRCRPGALSPAQVSAKLDSRDLQLCISPQKEVFSRCQHRRLF